MVPVSRSCQEVPAYGHRGGKYQMQAESPKERSLNTLMCQERVVGVFVGLTYGVDGQHILNSNSGQDLLSQR